MSESMDREDLDGKKRGRKERDAPSLDPNDFDGGDDKKNRGNYRCSKCNLPKKGHICPYQPRYRRRDQPADGTIVDVEIQVELDADMTVRCLPLDKQGLPESYLVVRNVLLGASASGKETSESSEI